MKKLFINRNLQLRSGWKIFITLASYLLLILIMVIIVAVCFTIFGLGASGAKGSMSGAGVKELLNSGGFQYVVQIVTTLVMILVIAFFWRIFDKGRLRDLGLTNPLKHLKELAFGLALGAGSMTLVFIVLLLFHQIEFNSNQISFNFNFTLAADLILFIFVALNEELFSRGYCMTVLKQTGSFWMMVAVSSAVFSAMHSFNPNIRPVGFVNIFLAGVLLAYMFLKSGNLWMPIGYHITWNYFQGNIFGLQVSGMEVKGLFHMNLVTENVFNGGKFGPEGGLAATAALLLGILAVWKFGHIARRPSDKTQALLYNTERSI